MTSNRFEKSANPRRRTLFSAEWITYFQKNRERYANHAPIQRIDLTSEEIRAVIRSIQVFQLGESGEGIHFLKCAEHHAAKSGDHDYLPGLIMFIAEEHRHAAVLGEVLDALDVPRIKKNWTNVLFRWLRHRAGLELTIIVLLTAEVIAQVYYLALRDATNSRDLQEICNDILHDEVAHIRFQGERLAILRASRPAWRVVLTQLLEKMLFTATITVVWRTHRSVFHAAHMTWGQYWRRLWSCFRRAQNWGNPAKFDWTEMSYDLNKVAKDSLRPSSSPHLLQTIISPRVDIEQMDQSERWLD